MQFEPGVRAGVEGVAHAGIAGADQRRGEDQPIDEMADPLVERIDQLAKLQQHGHCGAVQVLNGGSARVEGF